MPTTSRSWLNPDGTWLETHAQYDQCGSARNSWDALGKVSEVAYSSAYDYAYPTSTISADPDGAGALTALTSSTVYDPSGKVISTTDANGQTTSFEYAATTPMSEANQMQRLTKVNRPDGSWTKYSYGYSSGAYRTRAQSSIDARRYTDSYEYADGLGRLRRSFMNEGSAWIVSDTQYNTMGRVWRVSNPYRSTQGDEGTVNPSGEWTASIYDALGRVSTVTTPDTAVVSSYYSGNQVLVKDQAGKERMSQTNALGQLKEVWEITSADAWTEDISFPGHAEVTKAYHTSYAYDVLDNLTTVSQGVQTRTFTYDSLKRLTSATNPESGTIYYVYDANGNLTKKTDALGVYIDYTYDGLNRAATKNYSDVTPDVAYAYNDGVTNSKGHLTSVSSSVSATNYTGFDVMGKVTTATQVTDGQTYSMSYVYNLAGSQSSMTYPSGRVIETKYDAAGRMAGVKDQASGIYYAGASDSDTTNQMKYAPHGAVAVMKLGNGLWEHTTFNNRLQPTQIGLGTSSVDSSTLGLTNTYGTTNNNGDLLTAGYAGGGLSNTQTFGYDELNRLTTSSESGTSWSQLNKYDRYGNRWIDLSGSPSLTFNPANNRITNSGYTYDSPGNLKNDSTQSFAFDADNKIKTVSGEGDVYRYDADGNRVRKNFTNGEKVRMVYGGGPLIAEYDLSSGTLKKEYVYGAKGLLATIEPSAVIKYTTTDSLGTARVVTSSAGSVISRHDYKPFGENLGVGIGGRTTGMGYDVADGVRQKFTSKERDIETGLDYFLARYYSSTQGRFTSPDSIAGSVSNPQTMNFYAYVQNNPLGFVDPSGHSAAFPDMWAPTSGDHFEHMHRLMMYDFLGVEAPPMGVEVNEQETSSDSVGYGKIVGYDGTAVRETTISSCVTFDPFFGLIPISREEKGVASDILTATIAYSARMEAKSLGKAQPLLGKFDGDIRGHIVGRALGGPPTSVNLFSQDREVNNASYKRFENKIRRTLTNHQTWEADLRVELHYPRASCDTPSDRSVYFRPQSLTYSVSYYSRSGVRQGGDQLPFLNVPRTPQ